MAKEKEVKSLPAAPMTPEEAIKKIQKDYPVEAKIFEQVRNKEVAVLGTDEAFILRDSESGEIRAFRRSLTLSAADGTLIQPVKDGPFVISAQGYEVWAEAVGACVIFPPSVLVDGKQQPNPFVIRDEKNRRILAIYARAVAFRFSPMGIPMVSDWITIFDNPSYRLIDLLAKAKQKPQAFRLLPEDLEPDDKESGTWASYPFDESTNLWVNTTHEEALTWYSQILNREKKSIDFAQTFAKRNSLKHLSGLQKVPGGGNVWKITVTAWRATAGNIIKWDSTQYAALQDKVGNLMSGDKQEFKQLVQLTGAENLAGAEVIEHEETEVETEGPAATNGKEGQDAPELTAKEKIVMSNYRAAMKTFPEEYAKACEALDVAEGTEILPDMAEKIIEQIEKQMEG
jgi:hypothetical protein